MDTSKPPAWLADVNREVLSRIREGQAPGPSLYALTVPGRKTGQPRTSPVAVATRDGERYLVAGFADADWVKNTRAAGWAILSKGQVDERVSLTEIEIEERVPILRSFLRQVHGGRQFVHVHEDASLEEFLAAARGHPVFRVEDAS